MVEYLIIDSKDCGYLNFLVVVAHKHHSDSISFQFQVFSLSFNKTLLISLKQNL